MANAIYNGFKRDIQIGSIGLDPGIVKVLLLTSAFTLSEDGHTKRSDSTAG